MPPRKRHWSDRAAAKARGLAHGYRSGLEEQNAKRIEEQGQEVVYEQHAMRYAVPMSFHRYKPDFIIPHNGIIVETKGVFDAKDRDKHLLVRAQYPTLDIRLVFSRGRQPITPGSKTTVAMWADRNNFKWAEKLIPLDWFQEEGPGLEAVVATIKAGPVNYQEVFSSVPRPRRRA